MIKDHKCIELNERLIHSLRTKLTTYELNDKSQKSQFIKEVSEILESTDLLTQLNHNQRKLEMVPIKDVFPSTAITKNKRVRLLRESPSDRTLLGDSVLLRRLLDELIDNALEYSDGDVQVSEHLTENHLVWRVEDFGKGIPATVESNIAEPFVRGENVRKPGNGLGLAIAWAIAQVHNGAMTIISDEGQGTTVLVTLNITNDFNFRA